MTKKNIAPPKKSNRQKKTVKSKDKKFTFNTRVALGSQKNYQRICPLRYPKLLGKIKMIELESQNKAIHLFLKSGKTITGMIALEEFGCWSLSRRICDLKEKGVKIESQWVKLANGKRIKEYWMER